MCSAFEQKSSFKDTSSLMDKDLKAFMYAIILQIGIILFLLCLAGGYAYVRTLTPIMVIQGNR